ncbi:MAG TPA: hypothetical protein VK196_06445 [Magnetospirillum sp.]|nr:hypothetical protein [Magnetospirillum sp.]
MDDPQPAQDYRLFGWRLRASRPLAFLRPLPASPGLGSDKPAEVELVFDQVEKPTDKPIFSSRFTSIYESGLILLFRPEGIRIRIEDGRRLTVDVDPGVTDAELHTWLFGPALMMLCHQRKQPPLHACVVDIGGTAIAIAGNGGAGKSTSARTLIERGHRLLTDDQARIVPDSRLVYPGYPTMKLWGHSATAFGERVDAARRVKRGVDKFLIPLNDAFQPEAMPLAAVVVLLPDPSLSLPMLAPAPSVTEAIALLHRQVAGLGIARVLDQGRAAFHWASALAQRVPVRLLMRPEDAARRNEVCDVIESLARTA